MLVLAVLTVAVTAAAAARAVARPIPTRCSSQTFTGTHTVTSGNIDLTLTIDPSGSSLLSGPITLSFGGPFQTRGAGKLPESNFTVSASALGRNVALGMISTGTAGYVTLQGSSYQLPQATLPEARVELRPADRRRRARARDRARSAKLGIQPLHWLTNPTVVGTENVGGAQTTHIHAGVNVNALLTDLNTVLEKASSLGVSGRTARALKSGGSPPPTGARSPPRSRTRASTSGPERATTRSAGSRSR